MKKILFLINNTNNFGIFESFAYELKKNHFQAVFLDLNNIIKEKSTEEYALNRQAVLANDFVFHDYQVNDYPRHLRRYHFVKNIIDDIKPSLLVVPYEFHIFQIFILYSRNRGIKSLHIQHGLWNKGKFSNSYNYHPDFKIKEGKTPNTFSDNLKSIYNVLKDRRIPLKLKRLVYQQNKFIQENIHFPLTSDFIAVPSVFYKRLIIEERPDFFTDNILVTGYLRESIFNPKEKTELCEKFNIPLDKKIISYFYTPFQNYTHRYKENYKSELAMIDFLKVCNYIYSKEAPHFLVLIHPTQVNEIDKVKIIIREAGITSFTVDTSKNLQGTIYKHSLLIGGAKTAALYEARVLNTRVIQQDYVLEGNFDETIQFEGLVYVKNEKDLETSIIKIKNSNPDTNCELVRNLFGENKGSASTLLLSILKQRRII